MDTSYVYRHSSLASDQAQAGEDGSALIHILPPCTFSQRAVEGVICTVMMSNSIVFEELTDQVSDQSELKQACKRIVPLSLNLL